MVDNALMQAYQIEWEEIAVFVETKIVKQWLFYIPARKAENFSGPKSNMYLLATLDSARDKREHFATICMDLHKLGYNKFPYKQWADFLTQLYIGTKETANQPSPYNKMLGKLDPKDWGVILNKKTDCLTWQWTIKRFFKAVQDTSHANRTVWLATKAYHEGLIEKAAIDKFINTFKKQVWAPAKGTFYFNNIIDGTDSEVQKLGPGRKGNIWFGWHRLSAYDKELEDLFISIAYDLTGGHNIPNSQNKAMENAPICLLAWAARLISENGNTQLFP